MVLLAELGDGGEDNLGVGLEGGVVGERVAVAAGGAVIAEEVADGGVELVGGLIGEVGEELDDLRHAADERLAPSRVGGGGDVVDEFLLDGHVERVIGGHGRPISRTRRVGGVVVSLSPRAAGECNGKRGKFLAKPRAANERGEAA